MIPYAFLAAALVLFLCAPIVIVSVSVGISPHAVPSVTPAPVVLTPELPTWVLLASGMAGVWLVKWLRG